MALINADYLVMFGIFSEALLHCTEGFQAVGTFLFLFTVQEALIPAPWQLVRQWKLLTLRFLGVRACTQQKILKHTPVALRGQDQLADFLAVPRKQNSEVEPRSNIRCGAESGKREGLTRW
jgi:hypothetical protein